jgi:uncharacterized protein (TIGR02598 family)
MKSYSVKSRPIGRRFNCPIDCGFSLVEVVLALGIFSFSILSIVGLMAAGLNSANGSSTNLAATNIMRELRADVQSMPFSNLSRTGAPIIYYFGADGFQTTTPSAYFYRVALTPIAPTYPSAGSTSANADVISVTISYPYPANAQTISSSLFVAQ